LRNGQVAGGLEVEAIFYLAEMRWKLELSLFMSDSENLYFNYMFTTWIWEWDYLHSFN